MFERLRKLLAYATCFLAAFVLFGCAAPGSDPRALRLETSISSDGKLVAILANAGEATSRVQVMYLDQREGWIDLPTPPRTTSIRFGLQGHRLLITRLDPDAYLSEMLSIDLDEAHREKASPTLLFKGDVLAFPIEVAEGRYLVRHCKFTRVKCPWNLVSNGRLEREIASAYSLQYSQPVVARGEGFYWIPYKSDAINSGEPDAIAFPLEEGGSFQPSVPKIDARFDRVACDYSGVRCLWSYVEKAGPGPFLYNTKVLYQKAECSVEGVAGWSDGASISPDGRFGVKSLSEAFELPRHVVYFEFDPKTCQPVVVRHLPRLSR